MVILSDRMYFPLLRLEERFIALRGTTIMSFGEKGKHVESFAPQYVLGYLFFHLLQFLHI